MAGDDSIEEFLEGQREEGAWDSHGVFTAAPNKALGKLASYQLPRPRAWILKMVQAGVAAGAESISIELHQDGIDIDFRGADLIAPEQLEQAWTSPNASVSLAQRHLLVGLRAASVGQAMKVDVDWHADDGTSRLSWDGARLLPLEIGRDQGTYRELSFQVRGRTDWRPELLELRRHAVTCPVSLTVQGESLSHFGLGDVYIERKPVLFGKCEAEPGEPFLRLANLSSVDEGQVARYSCAWTLYWCEIPARNVISWTQHGVICQEEEFGPKGRFQLRMYFPGDHLENDMTGLHLRFPEGQSTSDRVGLAAFHVLEGLGPKSESAQAVGRALNEGAEAGAWSLAGSVLVCALLFVPIFGAGMVPFGGLAALAARSGQARHRRDAHEAFLTALEQWRAQLLADLKHRQVGD